METIEDLLDRTSRAVLDQLQRVIKQMNVVITREPSKVLSTWKPNYLDIVEKFLASKVAFSYELLCIAIHSCQKEFKAPQKNIVNQQQWSWSTHTITY